MKRMNKMMIICLLVCLLSGCQLAKVEETLSEVPDGLPSIVEEERLIGVLISLDNTETFKGEEKIYATKTSFSESNEGLTGWNYQFEQPNVYVDFVIAGFEQQGEQLFFNDTGGIHGFAHILYADDKEEMKMETQFYLVNQNQQIMISLNPIYLNQKNEVYAQSSGGMGFFLDSTNHESNVGSQTINQTLVRTVDGKETKLIAELKMDIISLQPMDSYVVSEINSKHKLISQKSYPMNFDWNSLKTRSETEYLIVEQKNGSEVLKREVISKGQESFSIFDVDQQKVGIQKMITIEW